MVTGPGATDPVLVSQGHGAGRIANTSTTRKLSSGSGLAW
jgi:hypothetical protein